MTVAVGTESYSHGSSPCTGMGRTWNAAELAAALAAPVCDIAFDREGTATVAALLSGLADTDFEQHRVADILAASHRIEDWRVGEAIAEAYLRNHRSCAFPWSQQRDERNRRSNLPGADLVGFASQESGIRFAFGEVKTSAENAYPPRAMYPPNGLMRQLTDLRDRVHLRHNLVKYLGHRTTRAIDQERYQAASKRYIANTSDVQLFGVLIRDVAPRKQDVRVGVDRLSDNCPDGTDIEFLALYLPTGSIHRLPDNVLEERSRRHV